jgi:hypothetical protein
MSSVRIGQTGAATVSRLLRDIAQAWGLPQDIRDGANRCVPLMRRRMERRDVERVTILLWNASEAGSKRSQRHQAQYWATYLEGRL